MNPKENHKDVEVNGRNFRVRKFDALTGSFMLIKLTGLLAPLLKNIDLKKLDLKEPNTMDEASDINLDAFDLPGIMSALGNLPEEDFKYIQGKCLRVCHESLSAGLTPVLNTNGSFAVMGLDEDTMTVMALTVHALVFNVKGFFTGSPLASLVGGLLNTSPRA
jgi:hypothetical protein